MNSMVNWREKSQINFPSLCMCVCVCMIFLQLSVSAPGGGGLTFTGLSIRGGEEAHVTLTAEPSGQVEAVAVLTQVTVVRTLVAIWTIDHTGCSSAFLTGSERQDGGLWCVTCTEEPVSREPFFAHAAVRTHGVHTVSVVATQVGPVGTLVQIWDEEEVERSSWRWWCHWQHPQKYMLHRIQW